MATSREGGYDYEFLNPDASADYICLICQSVSRVPQQSKCCGNIFCKLCIEKWRRQNKGSVICPACRRRSNFFEDKLSMRKIGSLVVYCTNKDRGCKWSGEIREVDKHTSEVCVKQVVKCPKGCGTMVERSNLSHHLNDKCVLRLVPCPHCSCSVRYDRYCNHLKICPKMLLPCTNRNCHEKIPRHELNNHVRSCKHRLVKCTKHCGGEMEYVNLADHLVKTCIRRIVKCDYCSFQGEYKVVSGNHMGRDCQEAPVACLNKSRGCQQIVKRGKQKEHLEVCPKETVECKYVGICRKEMMRDEESHHYTSCMDEHLNNAWLKLREIEKTQVCQSSLLEDSRLQVKRNGTSIDEAVEQFVTQQENNETYQKCLSVQVAFNKAIINEALEQLQSQHEDNEEHHDYLDSQVASNKASIDEALERLQSQQEDSLKVQSDKIEQLENVSAIERNNLFNKLQVRLRIAEQKIEKNHESIFNLNMGAAVIVVFAVVVSVIVFVTSKT